MADSVVETKNWSLWDDLLNKSYVDPPNVFTVTDTTINELFMTGILTIWLFTMLFYLTYCTIYRWIKPKMFPQDEPMRKKYENVVVLNAQVHHVIVAVGALYTIFAMCDRPMGMFYGDEMCLRTYKPFYSHLSIFTCAYLFFDFIMQVFVIEDFSTLGKQNIAHHFVTWICFTSAFACGRNFIMQSQICMLCEMSQIFLNLRNTLGKNATGIIPMINIVLFLLSYTLLRIVLFPALAVMHVRNTFFFDMWNTGKEIQLLPVPGSQNQPGLQTPTPLSVQIAWIIGLIFFILVYCLNLFWYKLILKGVYKIVMGKPTDEKKKKNEGVPVNPEEPLISNEGQKEE